MKFKFSYSQKLQLLPFVFIIILFIIYGIAIKDVLNLRGDCHALMDQIIKTKDAPRQMAISRQRLNELNQIAGKGTDSLLTDPLLEFISIEENHKLVQLVEYQPIHQFKSQHYQVETRIACFEGSFSRLLGLLYAIENNFKEGKVISVKYQTETNFKTNKRRLLMTLYIQSISNEQENISKNQNAG